MTTNIKFAKVHPNAKIPTKRTEDAAMDVYACFDEDYIALQPHETKLIPTGIASSCNSDMAFILKERGSTGSKGIALRCGVVDSGYRGEWFVCLTNENTIPVIITKLSEEDTIEHYTTRAHQHMKKCIIYPYSKAIAQVMVVPVPELYVEEISYEDLKQITSARGTGALGSSNK